MPILPTSRGKQHERLSHYIRRNFWFGHHRAPCENDIGESTSRDRTSLHSSNDPQCGSMFLGLLFVTPRQPLSQANCGPWMILINTSSLIAAT